MKGGVRIERKVDGGDRIKARKKARKKIKKKKEKMIMRRSS